MPGMWTRESNAVNPGNFMHQFKQGGEITSRTVWGLVVVDNLSEKMNFPVPIIGGDAHLFNNFTG